MFSSPQDGSAMLRLPLPSSARVRPLWRRLGAALGALLRVLGRADTETPPSMDASSAELAASMARMELTLLESIHQELLSADMGRPTDAAAIEALRGRFRAARDQAAFSALRGEASGLAQRLKEERSVSEPPQQQQRAPVGPPSG